MEEEEGFSPAVSIWGVLCSLICNLPAALSEGLPGTGNFVDGLESVKGVPHDSEEGEVE